MGRELFAGALDSAKTSARVQSVAAWYRELDRVLERWQNKRTDSSPAPQGVATKGTERLFIIPPSRPGSLGDQAYVEATVGLAGKMGWCPTLLLDEGSATWGGALSGVPQRRVPLHQSRRAVPALEALLDEMDLSEAVVALGADVACGAYGRDGLLPLVYAGEAAQRGHRAGVVSLGFDPMPDPLFVRLFQSFPRSVALVARDFIARERAERALDRPVALAADIAFAWTAPDSNPTPTHFQRWLDKERRKGRLLALVNFHSLLMGVSPFVAEDRLVDIDLLVNDVVQSLVHLVITDGVSAVLVPHDCRGSQSDEAMLARVRDRLPAEAASHVLNAGRVTVAESRWLASQVDVAVSGRMHLAISCLVSGTPVICVAYQDKFEGLLAGVGLDRLALSLRELRTPGTLSSKLAEAAAQSAALRDHIESYARACRQLAEANLAFLSSGSPD